MHFCIQAHRQTLQFQGKVANNAGTDCEDCPAGEYRGTNDKACVACAEGWKSAAGASICDECQKVRFETQLDNYDSIDTSRDSFEFVCIALKMLLTHKFHQGEYEKDRISCEKCPKGTYNNEERGQSGLNSCQACADGTVAITEGLPICKTCPPVSLDFRFITSSIAKR